MIYLQRLSVNSSIRIYFRQWAQSSVSRVPTTSTCFFFPLKFSFNYNVWLSTKYAVLQFESSIFFSSFLQTWQGYVQGKGAALLVSCDLMRRLQHLHEESVDGCVPNQFEEEQMLQTLEADGPQGGQAEQQLGKPAMERKKGKIFFFKSRKILLAIWPLKKERDYLIMICNQQI